MLLHSPRIFALFTDLARQLGAFDLVPEAEFARGARQLQHQALRIAHEVMIADDDDVPLGDAVSDHARYPVLARAHDILMTIPLWSPPAPVDAWMERALAGPQPAVVDTLRDMVVSTALEHSNPVVQALARFVLFESLAVNLRVLQLEHPEEMARLGIREDTLAHVAGLTLYKVIDEHRSNPTEPALKFERIVQLAAHELVAHGRELRRALRTMHEGLGAALRFQGKLAAALAQMSFPKSTLLRNAYATYFDEQPLSGKLLAERFAGLGALFPSEPTSRKQVSREKAKLAERGPAALRSGDRRFIDILVGRPAPAHRTEENL